MSAEMIHGETKLVSQNTSQELIVWALHEAGGSDRWVDIETIFWLAFELAPERFSWRTRKDLPDYQKCQKALNDLESSKLSKAPGLITKRGPHIRRLTKKGLLWCEGREDPFIELPSQNRSASNTRSPQDSKRNKLIQDSQLYKSWKTTNKLSCKLWELSELFKCVLATTRSTWEERLDAHFASARREGKEDIEEFIEAARSIIQEEVEE